MDKNKDDDDNNNNDEKKEEQQQQQHEEIMKSVNLEELEGQRKLDMMKVAKSLGLAASLVLLRKCDLYLKIKNYIETYKENKNDTINKKNKKKNKNKKKEKEDIKIQCQNIDELGEEEIFNLDLDELSNRNKVDILKVAKILNLPPNTTSGNKGELYQNIRNYIEVRKEYNQKRQQQFKYSNGNQQLAIKDISKGEQLFWKIFRNIVLMKEIYSNLNGIHYIDCCSKRVAGVSSFKYEDIVNVHWLLEFGHIELLKDKVKRKEPLVFCTNGYSSETFKYLFELTMSLNIDQLPWITEFYQTIFSHYRIDLDYYIDNIVNTAIHMKYTLVIQIILDTEGMYRVTIDKSIIPAIRVNSLKVVKLLLQHLDMKQDQFDLLNALSNLNGPSMKVLSYLISTNTFPLDQIKQLIAETPCPNSIIQPKLLELPTPNYNADDSLGYKELSVFSCYSLLDLINSCSLLVIFKKDQISTSMSIQDIELIKSKFKKPQLKLRLKILIFQIQHQLGIFSKQLKHQQQQLQQQPINQKLLQQIQHLHQLNIDIKGLIQLYISYNEKLKSYCSFIFKMVYNGTGSGSIIGSKNSSKTYDYSNNYFSQSLKYANSEYWFECSVSFTMDKMQWLLNKRKKQKPRQLLFKYCRDREKQLKYIRDIYNYTIASPREITILLYLIIMTDDLVLLKMVLLEFPTFSTSFESSSYQFSSGSLNFRIHNFIQSVGMLEFCFIHLLNHFEINSTRMYDFYGFRNFELLKSYDQLKSTLLNDGNHNMMTEPIEMVFDEFKLLLDHHKTLDLESFGMFIKMFRYIVENPFGIYARINDDSKILLSPYPIFKKYKSVSEIVSTLGYFEYQKLLVQHQQLFDKEILPDFQYILENTKIKYNPTALFVNQFNCLGFLNWVYKYRTNDIDIGSISGGRCKVGHEIVRLLIYKSGDIKSLFQTVIMNANSLSPITSIDMGTIDSLPLITSEIGKNGDIESLEVFVKQYVLPLIKSRQSQPLYTSQEYKKLIAKCVANFVPLIISAITYGNLNILSHVFHKYPNLISGKKFVVKENFNSILIAISKCYHHNIIDLFEKMLSYKATLMVPIINKFY